MIRFSTHDARYLTRVTIEAKPARQLCVSATDADTSKIINSIGNLAALKMIKIVVQLVSIGYSAPKYFSCGPSQVRLKWSGSLVIGHILCAHVCVCVCVAIVRFHLYSSTTIALSWFVEAKSFRKAKLYEAEVQSQSSVWQANWTYRIISCVAICKRYYCDCGLSKWVVLLLALLLPRKRILHPIASGQVTAATRAAALIVIMCEILDTDNKQ